MKHRTTPTKKKQGRQYEQQMVHLSKSEVFKVTQERVNLEE